MFITQMEINKLRIAKNGTMDDGAILRSLIKEDAETDSYKIAVVAERYYLGRHDVLDHDFQQEYVSEEVTDDEGKPVQTLVSYSNINRSNVRSSNAFFWVHVMQKVQYMLGREPSISVAKSVAGSKEYADQLHKTTDARFMQLLVDWATEASKGGKAWLKEYIGKDGKHRQAIIPRINGIPVYDTAHNKELVEFIYHYEVEEYTGGSTKVKRTHAEWWTGDGVTYWVTTDEGAFVQQSDRSGVRPHYRVNTYVTGDDGVSQKLKKTESKKWEHFPIIELKNNAEGVSDLSRYKDLIDAYDLIQSKGSNNAMDFNEFFAVLQGFGGETASAVVRKLRINQAVNVNGQGGNIELKQLDMAMAGRIDWLKLLRDAIHEFGMAVDIKKADFGSAPSGVSLKFQYTLLDLKTNSISTQMKAALQEHFWFITQRINKQASSVYDSSVIDVTFNKSAIMNDLETINMIRSSDDIVPERILLARHPFVDDPDEAMKEMEEQRKRKALEARKAMRSYGLPEDDDEEDDDE